MSHNSKSRVQNAVEITIIMSNQISLVLNIPTRATKSYIKWYLSTLGLNLCSKMLAAMLEDIHMAPPYIYTKIWETSTGNNSANNCSCAPKIHPDILFQMLFKLISIFLIFGKGINILEFQNPKGHQNITWLQTENYWIARKP